MIETASSNEAGALTGIEKLKGLLEDFSVLMSKENVKVKAHSKKALIELRKLDSAEINRLYTDFYRIFEICESARKDGVSLRETSGFVGYALKKMGMSVPKSFFEQLSSEDIVEVYDLSGIQIFRNMRFFDITYYSLADLMAYPWYELLDRSSVIMEELKSSIGRLLTSDLDLMPVSVPVHFLKELKSEPVNVLRVSFKYFSPVMNERGEKVGFAASCRIDRVTDESFQANGLSFI